MPRVFVYEHVTATGVGRDPGSAEHSLFVEGRAMLSAVSADFAAVPGVQVATIPEDVPPGLQFADRFHRLAASADWTLLVAPETDGELERLARRVLSTGGRLLGPSDTGIRLTANKSILSEIWDRAGVPTPRTYSAREPLRFPVVCKPRDGCGSEEVRLIHTAAQLAALPPDPDRVIQEFAPGQPASVAFLIGPKQTVPLSPTFQHLSTDGRFTYRGGELPIPPDLAERAIRFGSQAIAAVPKLYGFVGVDLILGERDVAIEINPRLTTSYVGLRALAETNLAGAMLDVCEGREVEVKWKPGPVTFGADGTLGWPTPSESRS